MKKYENGLRRGFKTLAETLAVEVRHELGLTVYDRLDPRDLAEHLGIPVVALPELAQWGASSASIRHFLGVARGEFSAMTVYRGTRRLVVENPSHSSRRRMNSLAHELSHVILEHEPGPAIGTGGCRSWSKRDEAESDWLGGVLLVPRPAALRIAREEEPTWTAAQRYGVSPVLMQWRMNHTGALRQARNERKVRKRFGS